MTHCYFLEIINTVNILLYVQSFISIVTFFSRMRPCYKLFKNLFNVIHPKHLSISLNILLHHHFIGTTEYSIMWYMFAFKLEMVSYTFAIPNSVVLVYAHVIYLKESKIV